MSALSLIGIVSIRTIALLGIESICERIRVYAKYATAYDRIKKYANHAKTKTKTKTKIKTKIEKKK